MDTTRALTAGLKVRPLSETVADIRDELNKQPVQ